MPRQPAKIRTKFAVIAEWDNGRDYAVEEHQGQIRRTVGRVSGLGRQWTALPIGGQAWTRRYPTRTLAVDAMRRREDCRDFW